MDHDTDDRNGSPPSHGWRGSRAQCLLVTTGSREVVAERLTAIAEQYALVDPAIDQWMPEGYAAPAEAKLGESLGFLTAEQRGEITNWWLARIPHANTPNWDLASTATIEGRRGLLLVEAKAHVKELSSEGKLSVGHPSNHERIQTALAEANVGLSASLPGWALSRDASYQLANRFAWSWKLASMGVPVVLVYLGFLGAREMRDLGPLLIDAPSWEWLVKSHARPHVPQSAWGQRIAVGSASVTPLIRSTPAANLGLHPRHG
jgi:hypothetical protein